MSISRKMNVFNHIEPLPQQFQCNGTMIVAGPCSAETPQQVIDTATHLHEMGIGVLRAGLWKPRTHPGSFEGVGTQGLSWLGEAKRATGMLIATEVALPTHVKACIQAGVDVLWIGARTTANPFAVQAIAEALKGNEHITVMVKNPISPDIELWIGALQRIYNAGITHIAAVHRGFVSISDSLYRNAPMWQMPIELKRRFPKLPLLIDPSHITGKSDMVAVVAQQALDMGFDGLMIEVHPCPEKALSDNQQQLTIAAMAALVGNLTTRNNNAESEQLSIMRRLIDQCDDEILTTISRRMHVVRQIGELKQKAGMQVVQQGRFNEILAQRKAQAQSLQLHETFVESLMKLIHEEAVTQQITKI